MSMPDIQLSDNITRKYTGATGVWTWQAKGQYFQYFKDAKALLGPNGDSPKGGYIFKREVGGHTIYSLRDNKPIPADRIHLN